MVKKQSMRNTLYFFAVIIISLLLCSCNDNSANVGNNITPTGTFARGADVSWLPQMEISGFDFYDRNGNKAECLQILKDNGINSIRLRTWVTPSNDKTNGHCSKKETVEMAQRAKAMGFKLMIDFHYSDSWADPSKQNKPEAWKKLSFEELETAVYDYTFSVLDTLESVNALPDWVLYHPALDWWDPFTLLFYQEGKDEQGNLAGFSNEPANMDYYYQAYPKKKLANMTDEDDAENGDDAGPTR